MLSFLLPCAVLILSGLAAWYLVVKRGTIVGGGPIKLVQIFPLGPKSRIVVLQFENEQLVLSDTGSQISLLTCKPRLDRELNDSYCSEPVGQE